MDSVMLRCLYPSVRRSNPTCGALETMFHRREASTPSWTRGSLGRVSESEPSFVRPVKGNRRKRLSRLNQNGKWVGLVNILVTSSIHHSHRVTDGTHPQTLESSPINRVSLMHPTSVVSEPQGTGTVQGVKERGKSERPAVMAGIGPRKRKYPT